MQYYTTTTLAILHAQFMVCHLTHLPLHHPPFWLSSTLHLPITSPGYPHHYWLAHCSPLPVISQDDPPLWPSSTFCLPLPAVPLPLPQPLWHSSTLCSQYATHIHCPPLFTLQPTSTLCYRIIKFVRIGFCDCLTIIIYTMMQFTSLNLCYLIHMVS